MEKTNNKESKGPGRAPRTRATGAAKSGERRPFRRSGNEEGGDRPRRTFGKRESGSDRPRRSFGRGDGDSDRPRRSFGRGDGDSDRPRRSFGRGDGDSDRPRRSFGRREGEEEKGSTPRYRGTTEYTPKPRKPKAEGESGVRLNKYISNSGICSRREADEYIQAGLVKVNDVIITELGTRVFQNDVVKFNDETIRGEEKVYIVMNKPKDFVTTTSDPHAEKTVMDLIAGKCHERVYPVGRLDKSTTGVLLLTNDGDLTDKLTHPSFEEKKIYQVTLDKNLKKSDFDAILSGVTLEDGPINADNLSYIDGDEKVLGIEIHSGRNRIVRRLFE